MHTFASGKIMSKWYLDSLRKRDFAEGLKIRNRTFQGVADAMAKQWGNEENLKKFDESNMFDKFYS
jgi:hypothetical protein